MSWTPLDTWIVVIGSLAAIGCTLPGTFLVLRGMSMLADSVAHSVLPGLVLAFLIVGGISTLPLLLGALVVGVAAAAAVQWIHDRSGLDTGSAMGVVFTGMFALGMLGVRVAADHVDLDLDCVLFGSLETTPLVRVDALPGAPPRAAVVLGVVVAVHAVLVGLLFKELRLATFDPQHAEAQGMRPGRLHLLITTMTAASTVAAFEAVGSVLVLAMVVTPAATASLFARRLAPLLALALGLSVVFVVAGHLLAIGLPGPLLRALDPSIFGRVQDASTPGCIAALAAATFVASAALTLRRGRPVAGAAGGLSERSGPGAAASVAASARPDTASPPGPRSR